MRLYIKNMKCRCCLEVVKMELKKMGFHYTSISLGEVDIEETLNSEMHDRLNDVLDHYELQLIDDYRILLTEKIKKFITHFIYHMNEPLKVNLSTHLSDAFHYNYKYLSNVFTSVEGKTIEHFIIEQKIQRVKDLLVYENLSFKEAAIKLNYSSMAHLSNQFKKVTGLSPSQYKKLFRKNMQEHLVTDKPV